MKKYILLFGLLFTFFSFPASAAPQLELLEYEIPIVETFDLVQNGSSTIPYILNLTKDFHVVTKMNWILHFDDQTLDWNDFGADSALTNGIFVKYSEGNMMDVNITTNYQLMQLAFNAFDISDDQNPKGHIIWIQHLLTSFIEGGIKINEDHTIQIYIQDDLTAVGFAIVDFTVTLKGSKTIVEQIFNEPEQRQDLFQTLSSFWKTNNISILALAGTILGALIIWRFFRR